MFVCRVHWLPGRVAGVCSGVGAVGQVTLFVLYSLEKTLLNNNTKEPFKVSSEYITGLDCLVKECYMDQNNSVFYQM